MASPSAGPPVAGIMNGILNNRSRMIQVTTLGVALGLFIMMRK